MSGRGVARGDVEGVGPVRHPLLGVARVTRLLDVDLTTAGANQLNRDLVAGALALAGPLGGDGAPAQVHLHLQTRLHTVLVSLLALVSDAIRKNLHWGRVVS